MRLCQAHILPFYQTESKGANVVQWAPIVALDTLCSCHLMTISQNQSIALKHSHENGLKNRPIFHIGLYQVPVHKGTFAFLVHDESGEPQRI